MIWRSLIAALIFIGTPSAAFAQIDPDLLADAEQGDAKAQFSLGAMYDKGEGVAKNDVEAVKWYRLAAEQGDVRAQNNLGLMYDNGRGVPEDDIEAVKLYRLAAEQGYEIASKNQSIVKEKMTPQQIAEAQAYATRCFENDYEGCD